MFYTVIGREKCPYCEKAKDLLIDKGAVYHYIPITDELKTVVKLIGFKTVPIIFLNASSLPWPILIGGYDDLVKHFE